MLEERVNNLFSAALRLARKNVSESSDLLQWEDYRHTFPLFPDDPARLQVYAYLSCDGAKDIAINSYGKVVFDISSYSDEEPDLRLFSPGEWEQELLARLT